MAVGTPLIASRLGALAEIVDDGLTGILVSPGDPPALAAAMRELWSDRSRASAMGTQSWLYAASISPRKSRASAFQLYNSLLA